MKSCKLLIGSSIEATFARETAERMAKDVLSNPVIEDYRVEIEA
jgi:phosphoribosylformylglycinamidine (FGAM) synthase PurS component